MFIILDQVCSLYILGQIIKTLIGLGWIIDKQLIFCSIKYSFNPTVFVPLLSSQSTLIVSVKILNSEDLNQEMGTEA